MSSTVWSSGRSSRSSKTQSAPDSDRTVGGTNTAGTNTYSSDIALDGSVGENRSANLVAVAGGTVAFTGGISGAGQNVAVSGGGTVSITTTAAS